MNRPLNSTKRRRLWGISLAGYAMLFVGALLWSGFEQVIAYTNSESFCISCHEMRDNVYREFKQSAHFSNASGVAATCSDCHVPKQFLPKMVRKVRASNDIYHTLLGTVDTPEKFNARRLLLAERVWATMKESDSRECRSCHSQQRMALELQDKRARKKHNPERMAKRGETCIDCHKGIAHELPDQL